MRGKETAGASLCDENQEMNLGISGKISAKKIDRSCSIGLILVQQV